MIPLALLIAVSLPSTGPVCGPGGCSTCPPGASSWSASPPAWGRGIGVGAGVQIQGPRGGSIGVDAGFAINAQAQPAHAAVIRAYMADGGPCVGVYVGVIGGHGVTLVNDHAARDGMQSIGGVRIVQVWRDKHGYDVNACITAPLSATPLELGPDPAIGDTVEIIGFRRRTARVRGYLQQRGQPWGELSLAVASASGDSGSAILDRQGRLVGILWGTEASGAAETLCVPAIAIRDFLARLEISLTGGKQPQPATPDTPAPDQTDDLAELRLLIEANAAAIAKLSEAAAKAGPPGPPGPKGDPATVDTDAIAAKVIADFPPLLVRRIEMKKVNGQWVSGETKTNQVRIQKGDGLTIRLYEPD